MDSKDIEQTKIETIQDVREYLNQLIINYHKQLIYIPKDGLERLQGAIILANDILGKIEQIKTI